MCESRPLCEGVQLAAAWAEAGIECTIITDAQVLASAGWLAGRQAGLACLHSVLADFFLLLLLGCERAPARMDPQLPVGLEATSNMIVFHLTYPWLCMLWCCCGGCCPSSSAAGGAVCGRS